LSVSLNSSGKSEGYLPFAIVLSYLLFSPLLETLGLRPSNAVISLMDWQRIAELLVVALVIMLLAPRLLAGGFAGIGLPPWQCAGLCLFFGLGAISSSAAARPEAAWLEWLWTMAWFSATFLLASALCLDFARLRATTSIWVIAVLASYSTLFYVTNSDALFDRDHILSVVFPGFNNVRPLSDYQTIIIPLIPLAISSLVSHRWRWAAWMLASSYVAISIATGSRSIVLGQSVAIVAVVILFGRESLGYLSKLLRVWFSGAAFYALFFWLLPWWQGGWELPSTFLRFQGSGREDLWLLAWTMVKDNPWLGVGPMHFAVQPNGIAASPHNHPLQLAAEWGMPATLAFFFVLAGLLRKWRSVEMGVAFQGGVRRSFGLAVFTAFCALLAQSLVSPVFNNPASQMELTLLTVLAAASSSSSPLRSGMLSTLQPRIGALLAIVALALFAWQVAPWVARIEERNACYLDTPLGQTPTSFFAPRFWQQGWIFPPCENFDR